VEISTLLFFNQIKDLNRIEKNNNVIIITLYRLVNKIIKTIRFACVLKLLICRHYQTSSKYFFSIILLTVWYYYRFRDYGEVLKILIIKNQLFLGAGLRNKTMKTTYLVSVRNVNTKRHCEEARRSNLLMNNDIQ